MDDLELGSSIAVNGVCLTVRSLKDGVFTAELSRETLDRTTLDALNPDSIVNLERPMRADSRFGGHIVQGHVDGVGRIHSFERHEDSWDLEVDFPEDNARYIVEKGSIAVDGISLTVAACMGQTHFRSQSFRTRSITRIYSRPNPGIALIWNMTSLQNTSSQ